MSYALIGDVGVSPAVKMLKEVRSLGSTIVYPAAQASLPAFKEVRSPGRTIDATGDAGISPAHKEVWSPGLTIDATEDAGVSPADVLVQNEVFCVDFYHCMPCSYKRGCLT